jgi:hypothetical protein
MKSDKKPDKNGGGACPVTGKSHDKETGAEDPRLVPAKCPFGYDSNTFKLGPLSCMVCQALLHDASKCKPCLHKFCKWVLLASRTRHCFLLLCVCADRMNLWQGVHIALQGLPVVRC